MPVIEKIKETENKAQGYIRKAEEDKREIVAAAKTDREKKLADFVKEMEKENDRKIEEQKEELEKMEEKEIKKIEEEKKELQKTMEKNKSKTDEHIESVIKNYLNGNS
ncbi:MAG: hypothetical protein ACQESA_03815 [Patescibacteria group bacterium]